MNEFKRIHILHKAEHMQRAEQPERGLWLRAQEQGDCNQPLGRMSQRSIGFYG